MLLFVSYSCIKLFLKVRLVKLYRKIQYYKLIAIVRQEFCIILQLENMFRVLGEVAKRRSPKRRISKYQIITFVKALNISDK